MRTFVTATAIALTLPLSVEAAPISVNAFGDAWELFHYRNRSGPNSAGFQEQDRLIFGAVNVVPNGKGEDDDDVVSPTITTGIARQNDVERDLTFFPTTINPNQYGAGVEYDETLTGSWEFEFTNGDDTLVVNGPEVGDVGAVERVTNMRITSGSGTTTPRFEWDPVQGSDRYTVSVYDTTNRNLAGGVDRIFVAGLGNELSFTIPDGVLSDDDLYTIEVRTQISRTDGTNPSGSSQAGSAVSINRTFFDFTLVDLPQEGDLYLPEVDVNTNGNPIFNFDNPVLAEQIQFYDPLVAVGYDYMIGATDPFFNSFILPEIGDSLFDLHLWNGTEYVFDSVVNALSEFTFALGGVDRFRILGIETGAALNPNDPTAFVTGLSFVSNGQFTGSMTPITEFVPELSAVPLPGSLPMLGFAIGGIYFLRRATKLPAAAV